MLARKVEAGRRWEIGQTGDTAVFAVPRQPRDFAVLFNLFSRRKKIVTPATEAAPTLVEPTEVVESLPAATVVAPAPAEVVEETRAVAESVPAETTPGAATPTEESAPIDEPAPTEESAPIDEPAPTEEAPVAAEVTPADVTVDEATVPSTPAPAPAVVRPPTVPELRAQAKALGLTGYSRLPKAELLRVIAEHHTK